MTVACLMLLGLFYAATDGMLAALASRLVGPEKVATGIGAAQTVVALCRMAASAGFGILWYAIGAAPPCWRRPSRWLRPSRPRQC